MQFFTIILALAATAFVAPNVAERQNQGCFEPGHVCISTSDCCNYHTGAGGSCNSAGVCT